MKEKINLLILVMLLLTGLTLTPDLTAQQESSPSAAPQQYRAVVLPPDGGADSFLSGYLSYAALNNQGTLAVSADTSSPAVFNSYTWTNGKQVDFQPLPQLPNLTGTNTYINWINQWGGAVGFGTRINTTSGAALDQAALWTPDGHVFPLSTPEGDQSHAVWVNDFGQVSGWIENETPDPCAFGTAVQNQAQAVIWQTGQLHPLGTLGGTDSYGEFINNLGQVSGHSQTSDTPSPISGCPPIDPFVWEDGKMRDINPGNFGGDLGGTNFLNNRGQAVGFGYTANDAGAHGFLWSRGKLTDLYDVGNLGGALNSALNVNELGHVVGVSSTPDGSLLAVLWRNGEFTNLSSLTGDDCSEPYFIDSQDRIVGTSFSCETGVMHAFLWENGQMVDLNTLIPSDSGIQLLFAQWINEEGEIAAQGVLTSTGASRAVLLIPVGEYDREAEAGSPATRDAAVRPSTSDSTSPALQKSIPLFDDAGRLNPRLLRPFSPAMLQKTNPRQ